MRESLFSNTAEEEVLYYFEEISRIPRGSGNEKQISDYLLQWASGLGLDAFQDEQNSLIIKKAATEGYEAAEPVILQAHMDMVCEKHADSVHDFEKEGIALKREGDMLMSADGTTLGADDGLGVAFCMAALASKSFVHPPLEVILTTEEETSFAGAAGIDMSRVEGKRLINLDHAVEDEVVAGSCGGTGIRVRIPLRKEEQIRGGYSVYRICISGLQGGHSGEDINKGRGSAIQLLNRMLSFCREEMDAGLSRISGGTNRLAISREAEAVILLNPAEEKKFFEYLESARRDFSKEYQATAPDLRIEVAFAGNERLVEEVGYTKDSFEKVLALLTLFPDGICQMNGAAEGVVESSINLGKIEIEGNELVATAEIRGAFASTVEAIKNQVICLTKLLGGNYECFDAYSPWECRLDSPLRALAAQEYRELFGSELKTIILHAGLECGFFTGKRPELDAISIGPNCWYFHSPSERVSISSVKKVWVFLKQILTRLGGDRE